MQLLQDLDAAAPSESTDHVVVLDGHGHPVRVVPKSFAHHRSTELHLAFSCYVVRGDGAVLLTRRAADKVTWPGSWTNGCCGHPQLGETLRDAVTRHLRRELGVTPTLLALALPDFAYQATMSDGTREHELCPVVIAGVAEPLSLNPAEADSYEWVKWDELIRRAARSPETLSPWCVEQVAQLVSAGIVLPEWATDPPRSSSIGLDRPVALQTDMPRVVSPTAGSGHDSQFSDDIVVEDPLESISVELHGVLADYLDAKEAELAALDPALREVSGQLRALIEAGGKRLRPSFVYWGYRASGAAHDARVLLPAAAMELLHTFALVHDDVMDRSTTRRGRPSAYTALSECHRQTERVGDAEWFGVSAAVLAGDLAFVWADELFDACALAPTRVEHARRVFTELRTEVIAGQYLDLLLASDRNPPESRARRVALLKSARYTVTRPLLIGAALGGVLTDSDIHHALSVYGDNVGVAFQMRDDILGVFGDPSVTGKSTLDDLREGKQTLLVLKAQRMATVSDRAFLELYLGNPELTDSDADRCREIIVRSGALASVEALIANQHEVALSAIGTLDDPARDALEQLALLAIERER